jgi:lactoylglutathione lyase
VTESLNNIGAITLFVEDRTRSKSFYEKAFALPLVFEDDVAAVFQLENMVLNLLEAQAAHELIDPAPVAIRDAGARFQLTIWVEDADAACAQLTSRGVELLNGPLDRDWGVRTAAFADPDGHIWEIAEKIPA